MSPETRTLLDIYMALRAQHLTVGMRYHSDLPIEVRQQFETAWDNFSNAVGAAHQAVALYEQEKEARATIGMFGSSNLPIPDRVLVTVMH